MAPAVNSVRLNAMTADDKRQAWYAEAFAMEIEGGDFDVAGAACLPTELFCHIEAANLDLQFSTTYADWMSWLFEVDDMTHLLIIEQSCTNGVLLTSDLRDTRVLTAPVEPLALVTRFFSQCPRHVAVHLAHYVFWFVRSERGRRRGTVHWSAEDATHSTADRSLPFPTR